MTTKKFVLEKEHSSDRMLFMLHFLGGILWWPQIHCVAKAGLKFIMILQPQPPEWWDYIMSTLCYLFMFIYIILGSSWWVYMKENDDEI